MIHVFYPEELSKKAASIAGDPDGESSTSIEHSADPNAPALLPNTDPDLDTIEVTATPLDAALGANSTTPEPITSDNTSSNPEASPEDLQTACDRDLSTDLTPDPNPEPEPEVTAQPEPYELCTEGPLTYFQYYLDEAEPEANLDYAPQVFSTSKLPTGLIGAGVLAVTVVSGFMIAETTKQPTLPPSTALNTDQNTTTPTTPTTAQRSTAQPSKPETIVAAKPLVVAQPPALPNAPHTQPEIEQVTPATETPQFQIRRDITLKPMAIAQPEVLPEGLSGSIADSSQLPPMAPPSLPEPLPSVTIPREEPLPPNTRPAIQDPALRFTDPGSTVSTDSLSNPSNIRVNSIANTADQPTDTIGESSIDIANTNSSRNINNSSNSSPSSPLQPSPTLASTTPTSTTPTSTTPTSTTIEPAQPTATPPISDTQPIGAATPPASMPSRQTTDVSSIATDPARPIAETESINSPSSPETAPITSTPASLPNPSQVLNSLRDLQDYLTVPQKLANVRSIDLLPLNLTAATEANTRPIGTPINNYTIVRMSYSDYAQAWRTSSNPNPETPSESSAGSSMAAIGGFPPHGFIDYRQQRIVLPQENSPTAPLLRSPSTQVSQTLSDR